VGYLVLDAPPAYPPGGQRPGCRRPEAGPGLSRVRVAELRPVIGVLLADHRDDRVHVPADQSGPRDQNHARSRFAARHVAPPAWPLTNTLRARRRRTKATVSGRLRGVAPGVVIVRG